MAWVVVVEEIQEGGQSMRWSGRQAGSDFPDREQARAEALRLCSEYTPQHPWSEQNRTVYRRSPDSYLVHLVGAMSDFHFTLSVAERIAPETGQPDRIRAPRESTTPQNDRFFAP